MLPRPTFRLFAILVLATAISTSRRLTAAENRPNDEQLWSEAETRIEQHRKADATILVTDAAGTPVEGAEVQIEQTRHAFLFGCNIFAWGRVGDEASEAAYRQRSPTSSTSPRCRSTGGPTNRNAVSRSTSGPSKSPAGASSKASSAKAIRWPGTTPNRGGCLKSQTKFWNCNWPASAIASSGSAA